MKNFLLLMFAAAALTACSNGAEESQLAPDSSEIKFALAGNSRAEDFTLSHLRQHGFVCSVKFDEAYVGSKVTANFDGEVFRPDERLFWPAEISDGKPCHTYAVSWKGIADHPRHLLAEDCGFALTTADNAADQLDIIVARTSSTSIPDGGIESLRFTHALTKVNFTVYVENKPVNAGYIWQVKSIKVKCLNSGEYSFADPATPWTIGESSAMHQYMKPGESFQLENGQNWVGNNSLMLIPQAGKKVTATVAWEVYKVMGNSNVKVSVATANKTFTLATEGWLPNANLRYTNLRLPNIGEKTRGTNPGDEDGDGNGDGNGPDGDQYDDNYMLEISYNPDVQGF